MQDATGRALYFLNRPLNDSLVKVLPTIVREIRAGAPTERVILVFDRGGYSGPGFRALTERGIGFLTYLKGRKARRRFPADRFRQRWWALDDPTGIGKRRRHVYRVYERRTRIRGAGLVRTVVVQDEEGQQIPVLTNCAELPAAKAVHLLRLIVAAHPSTTASPHREAATAHTGWILRLDLWLLDRVRKRPYCARAASRSHNGRCVNLASGRRAETALMRPIVCGAG